MLNYENYNPSFSRFISMFSLFIIGMLMSVQYMSHKKAVKKLSCRISIFSSGKTCLIQRVLQSIISLSTKITWFINITLFCKVIKQCHYHEEIMSMQFYITITMVSMTDIFKAGSCEFTCSRRILYGCSTGMHLT